MTSLLVPSNTCGAYISGVLGVPTASYLPYRFLNFASPILDVIFGCVGFKVPRADEVQSEPGAEGALPVVPEADSLAPFTTRPA